MHTYTAVKNQTFGLRLNITAITGRQLKTQSH